MLNSNKANESTWILSLTFVQEDQHRRREVQQAMENGLKSQVMFVQTEAEHRGCEDGVQPAWKTGSCPLYVCYSRISHDQ